MKIDPCDSAPAAIAENVRPLVLIVDDETFMRVTLREKMSSAGWRVEVAGGGEEALAIFRRYRPDLVILDLVMPGMDGFETCAALRRIEGTEHTPVLALTGLDDTASIHRAFEVGASDFISKAVNEEILVYRASYLLRSGRAFRELLQREADFRLLRAAVESLPIGITISDAMGKIVYTNPAEASMHGFEVDELLHRDARSLAPRRLHRRRLPEKLVECGVWRRESVNRSKRGEEFHVQLSSVSVRGPEGDFIGMVTACEDITERKENEERIHYLAYYDSLTGLPNRTLFLDRLQKALALAERAGKEVALLFLDIDNFKQVNDSHGHDFGDRLLRAVAERLTECVREADTLARLGGDEFVVMLGSVEGRETAVYTARRILDSFRFPLVINDQTIQAGLSIGAALYPENAPNLEGLLRMADAAMYQAKARGRANFMFFSEGIERVQENGNGPSVGYGESCCDLQQEESKAILSPSAGKNGGEKRLRAIVIEADNRRMMRRILEKRRYQTRFYTSPCLCTLMEGAPECRRSAPCGDILLIDYQTSYVNGMEFVEEQFLKGCKMPVENKAVFLAERDEELRQKARELGCAVFDRTDNLQPLEAWLGHCEERLLNHPL